MKKSDFKGVIGLAEMYCDTNMKRRSKRVDKYLKDLTNLAIEICIKNKILEDMKEKKGEL